MVISQTLHNEFENTYDNDISISEIPKGFFPAIIRNQFNEGEGIREVIIDIRPLDVSPGGTMKVNTGFYKKKEQEQAIKVRIQQAGKELASDTHIYSN